jgi:hypothetical protein
MVECMSVGLSARPSYATYTPTPPTPCFKSS